MNLSEKDCMEMLSNKYAELVLSGENRYPRRDDFTPEEVSAVKSVLGPWPRALEKAGVKSADAMRNEKKEQRRINQKRARTRDKISRRSETEKGE